MPRIDWRPIEARAQAFADEWAGETYERGESQSFWTAFLEVFGIHRRRSGAMFEYSIRKLSGRPGFIDLFWPGRLVVEQKSAGRDLRKAGDQAFEYLDALPDHEQPRFVVACDFATFDVLDRDTGRSSSFTLDQLPEKVRIFAPLLGETSRPPAEENPVNRDAAEEMATLHNALEQSGYTGHDLEVMLVRLVFCLFADDAFIFEYGSFSRYLVERTDPDGSDLGPRLSRIFQVLNTPEDRRQTGLDPDLRALPYVNGGLFAEPLRDLPDFTAATRRQLIRAARLDWSSVSPAIFGSMFQGVMDPTERRSLGAHYTSETNILRVIQPLFLDELYAEFARVRDRPSRLRAFHAKLATINVLDPACGCGNFLVITYRELRRLEHKVAKLLFAGQRVVDVGTMLRLNVNQLHGIEIEEFPALVARTALWLTDHQLNREASKELGATYTRIPLTASANIQHANALATDWRAVVAPDKLSYIIGNPPFVGSKYMTATMREELLAQFPGVKGAGVLDFVTAWYAKAREMMEHNPAIRTALVSTNSITQGEQVGILWNFLQSDGLQVDFAHRTFRWSNEGRNVAAVYCVVIGFSLSGSSRQRWIYDYPDIRGEPVPIAAKTINPYLVDAPTVYLPNRGHPISPVPEIGIGNKPIDGGHYLFTPEEKAAFVMHEPLSEPLFRRWVGSREFINGIERWCLWLRDTPPGELRSMPEVMKRVEAVRDERLKSKSAPTRALAATPTHFHVENIPSSEYIALPKVSSERRTYIPIGFMEPDVLASDLLFVMPQGTLYHFGILTGQMHMAWTRAVCGRLEGRYRYSAGIVYNNFPWPDSTDAQRQRQRLTALAQAILDARARYPEATLADLYDPLTMPADLLHAHQAVDRAVDRLYRAAPFATDADRVAFLFTRYAALCGADGLTPEGAAASSQPPHPLGFGDTG